MRETGPLINSPLAQLVTAIMAIGRKCPAARGDMLTVMLLVNQLRSRAELPHEDDEARLLLTREIVTDGLTAALGDELSNAQIERATAVLMALLRQSPQGR